AFAALGREPWLSSVDGEGNGRARTREGPAAGRRSQCAAARYGGEIKPDFAAAQCETAIGRQNWWVFMPQVAVRAYASHRYSIAPCSQAARHRPAPRASPT